MSANPPERCFVAYINEPGFLRDFIKLTNLAGQCEVSFSLNYQDCDHQWFVNITSAAPSEEWMTRDYSLYLALESAIEHLEKLMQPNRFHQPKP